jgi:hypothetical protein
MKFHDVQYLFKEYLKCHFVEVVNASSISIHNRIPGVGSTQHSYHYKILVHDLMKIDFRNTNFLTEIVHTLNA